MPLVGSYRTCFQEKEARDDLEAVRDATLHFAEQGLLLNEPFLSVLQYRLLQ